MEEKKKPKFTKAMAKDFAKDCAELSDSLESFANKWLSIGDTHEEPKDPKMMEFVEKATEKLNKQLERLA